MIPSTEFHGPPSPYRYYYGGSDLLKALCSKEIKLSIPSDLNDVFEGLASLGDGYWTSVSPDRQDRAFAAKNLQGALGARFRYLCVSRKSNDARMWAQYAQNHRGLMLTIDLREEPFKTLVERGYLMPVIYTDEGRSYVDWRLFHSDEAYRIEAMKRLLTTKGVEWEQEREERFVFPLALLDSLKEVFTSHMLGDFFEDFLHLPFSCIARVTAGHRISEKLLDSIIRFSRKEGVRWEIAIAKPSDCHFSFIEDVFPDSQFMHPEQTASSPA